jgi:hypothetical protein
MRVREARDLESARLTLNALASHLAGPRLADSALASANSLSFLAVVARAIHSLQSDGKLTYFEPVATRPGFPAAVARTLEELRMNDVEGQAYESLSNGAADLSLIARAVERALHESKLGDRAVIFHTAIDVAISLDNLQPLGLPLLLLDLPLRTRLEIELIRAVSLHSPDVFATAPFGDERAMAAFEAALDCKRNVSTAAAPANSLWAAKQHLFEESVPPVATLDDSLNFSSWPGEPRECVEIVRKIQSEAAQGIAFDQMAVLLNSSNEYRPHLEEAFNRAEIPAYFARGSTAPDPGGRALLALLSCAAEKLSARRFAEYLSLGQVPDPEEPQNLEGSWVPARDELLFGNTQTEEGAAADLAVDRTESLSAEPENRAVIEGNLRAPWRWERLLVDSAVIGGKDRWVRRLDGLANELRLQLAEAEAEESPHGGRLAGQLRDLEHLRAFALPIVDLLAALPTRASWGQWLTQLRELALATVRDPSELLATLAELEPMAPVGPVDLYEVQLVLEPRAAGVERPATATALWSRLCWSG